MDRPRVVRLLRIAVSVLSLTACVLLIALWVRSNSHRDAIQVSFPFLPLGLMVISHDNQLMCFCFANDRFPLYHFEMSANAVESWAEASQPSQWGFALGRFNNLTWLCLPHWFLTAMIAVLPAVPRIPQRFSLRTLLIATTLFAVALGIIIAVQ